MRNPLIILAFLSCSIFQSHAEINQLSPKSKYQLNNEQRQLAFDDYWLTLLYYQKSDYTDSYESFVDDDRFFFATDGKFNPVTELQANIDTFIEKPEFQCTFPARTKWLVKHLPNIAAQFPQVECSKYNEWREKLNTESVVLVYAASQLNSPSSMYGHTFIRFDPYDVEKHSTYLSHAINFGASVPENASNFSYALRGLAGGYPGRFATNPYFEKIKEYNRAENRDLWEYKLNLTADEVDRMLTHVWELQGINFDYYFFDENCSFRLLELIDVAKPGSKLVKQFPGVTIPIDTVRAVRDASLISEVHYRPSIRTDLENQLDSLPKEHRALAIHLSNDINVRESDEFTQLAREEKQAIVHAAYRLIRFLHNKDERSKAVASRSFQLLKMIRKESDIKSVKPKRPLRPDLGHDTTMYSIQLGESNEHAFADFTYRASYHDLIDNIPGYGNGMSLNMGEIVLRASEDTIQLQKAEFIDITSLSVRNDFMTPMSWMANVGAQRQWTHGDDKLVARVSGGAGVSYEPVKFDRVFLMLTGRLEYNQGLENNFSVAPGVTTGYLRTWQNSKSILSVSHYEFIDDQSRTVYNFEHNWSLSKNHSLRLHAKRSVNDDVDYDEFGVSWRGFF
ncbi:DUF4105 domain-containing protein [Thalassotalea psychrophila]|uniref:DUF4105 domain-containing protein n=1 Tax=Thalassotalea psychrophila TaxID=3065647 RepID=A0ABY9TQ36_9GAMM|nr:DUF4105 domain-containing protein [Colwelliaceae bacterium SQ149]